MSAVTLSWGGRALANFTALHNPKTILVPGTSPSGGPLAPLDYTPLTVGATKAYRLVFTRAPGSAEFRNPEQLSARKGEYVIIVQSMGLTQAQDDALLGVMLLQL